MKGFRKYLIYILFFAVGFFILGLIGKSFLTLAIYSVSIILGAIIIAWAAESSEVVLSEGLALAIVAWLQVFPEFMIEATISWAQDIPNMLSNFTGANRILVGVGWPLVFFVTTFFYRKKHKRFLKEINLKKEHSIEVIFFLIATLYSIIIFFIGKLTIIDSIIMGGIYITYLIFVSRLPHLSRKKSKKLIRGVPKKIIALKKKYIKPVIALMFLAGGLIIYFVANPFYNNALILATSLGVSQFLFIQWIAPFLSEFPEKTSAFYWSSKVKQAPMALMNLISSKLTQWTLLLAMIPIVFSISRGALSSIPLNSAVVGTTFTISTEFLLTIASSFYASTLLMKLRFTWFEASSLLVLFLIQFVWVSARPIIIWFYFGLALLEMIIYRKEIEKVFSGFKHIFVNYIRKRNKKNRKK
jgi:cation:H+ antiporter